MFVPQHAGVVNRITPNMFTAGKNIREPEEWLAAILYSGQVTRIGQHLALVLFHIASEKGVASLSMRELQEITGWGKTTICDHLREIEGFIKTTFGKGRGKSTFELQGIITTAVEELRSVRQPDTKGDEPIASVRETDTNPDTNRSVREADSKPDTMADTNPSVRLPDTKTDTTQFSVRQPDTNSVPSRARIETPSGLLFTKKDINTPLPPKGPTKADALAAFGAYNETALRCGLPQAAKLTPDRERKIIARLKDYGLDGWQRALGNIEKSAFLTGGTDHGFRADLDFVCQAKSFGKLHDGGYGNGRHRTAPRQPVDVEEIDYEALRREAGIVVHRGRDG